MQSTKHKHKEFAEFDHDCVKGDILSRYIYFYTTFQLVYIYWLYKVIYMDIKCKNKNTYSEGMALKCCI